MTGTYRIYFEENSWACEPSRTYDWSTPEFIRIIDVRNSDVTGTSDYIELVITSSDPDYTPDQELFGQISDGLFENDKYRGAQKLIDGRWCRCVDSNGQLIWKPLTEEE